MTYEEILSRFKIEKRNGDKVQCKCPCHDDKKASMTITNNNGKILIHCHAGCSTDDILSSVGLTYSDLHLDDIDISDKWKNYVESRAKKHIEAVYNYSSCKDGSYAFTKVRLKGKSIIYGILNNDRFTYGLNSKSKKDFFAVYGNLKKIKDAISNGESIFIPEGEKDVDTLTNKGYAAFTYGGVNDWQSGFSQLVNGAVVYILADNDEPGRTVAKNILNDIKGVTKNAKIIIPMPDIPKADVTDYFEAGHSTEEFEQLISNSSLDECQEEKEIDKLQFHLISDSGKITGVYHNAIFEYIKKNYHIFIVGATPYIYENGYYKMDNSGSRLKSIIRDLIYPQFVKSTTINNIYALFLQDIDLEVDFEQLNNYPAHWICFKNGMYDAKKKKMVPHRPEYMAINQIPRNYIPGARYKGEKIEEFLNFALDEWDNREMYLQYTGYAMTKDVSQQKFLVFFGGGGTGKSTAIRLMELLFGSKNVSNISLMDLQQRFASFGLMGKLLNSCADLEIQALEDTSVIKKVLGEDTLRAEQKGKDAISFKSYAKMVFSTNELPLVKSEKTNGFYRRLLALPMNKVPDKKNPDLFQELEREIDYFLQLAVQALERMYEGGNIINSSASQKAILQLRADSDTVEAFLQDKCEQDTNEKIERTGLYQKYINYCEETDRQGLTKNNFYKSLRVKGFEDEKSNGTRYFKGISYKKSCPVLPSKTALDGFYTVTEEQINELPFD